MATTLRDYDSIDLLDLPIRAYNALYRNNRRTIADAVALTEAEFLHFRGVGVASLRDLQECLARHGLAMAERPPEPPDPATVAEAAWVGRQLDALADDERVYARNGLGARWEGEGASILNRRRAWAWFRWGTDTDAEWPRLEAGGFAYMAAPLPGGLELHLEGLNRLARQELDG